MDALSTELRIGPDLLAAHVLNEEPGSSTAGPLLILHKLDLLFEAVECITAHLCIGHPRN
jgi:hypothetical protein